MENGNTSSSPVAHPTPGRSGWSARRRQTFWGYVFISPWIIGFLVFNLYPIAAVFYYGLTDYSGLKPPTFAGLENYVEMFQYDQLFFKALGNTAVYVAIRVPLHILLGFVVALLVHRKLRGINLIKTGLYIPTIVPYVTSVILWMWLLDYDFGVVNAMLRSVDLPPIKWLSSEIMAKPSIVLIGLWRVGTIMMTFLAGLNDIPGHLYEAAEIDGANGMQKLFHVTIPMVSPVIFFNLVLDVINSFQVFTAALVATGGGPLNATLFYVLHVYRNSFAYLKLGYGSALATVLFIIVVIFTALLFRTERHWVSYERT